MTLDLQSGDRIELRPQPLGRLVDLVLSPNPRSPLAAFMSVTRTITAYEAESLGAALLQAAREAKGTR